MLLLPPDLARRALDSAPDAMIIIGTEGLIGAANRQASALFGYSYDELIGRSVELLIPEHFHAWHLTQGEFNAGSSRPRPQKDGLKLFGRRKNGTEFPVEISLSPIEDNAGTLVAATIHDVSERQRIEAELRAQLEDMRRLRAMDEAALRTARDLAQRADQLVNGLLDIRRLDSGAVKPDPSDFAVRTLFEELRTEFASLAEDKGLSLRVIPCEAFIHSDAALVGRILRNLLANAIKYTQTGWVALRATTAERSLVRLEVLDTGIGIPVERLHGIYDEFYQSGVPANATRDGNGLGLSIVQRLVRLLDAKLEVESRVGEGTTFALTLPAATARMRGSVCASREPQPLRVEPPTRRFLVEDDSGRGMPPAT